MSENTRHKNVRFVEVHDEGKRPSWLVRGGSGGRVLSQPPPALTLHPPELPPGKPHELSPIVESNRPPAPPPPPPPPEPEPGAPSLPPLRRPDTMVEDLVPRAEEEAVRAIAAAVEQFHAERQAQLQQAESELLELLRVIASKVVGRELSTDPGLVSHLVREGLEALGQGDRITVRLGPFFADAVAELEHELEERGINGRVQLDSRVGLQGCVIETALGRVDESVQRRLDHVLDALSLSPGESE